MSQEWRRVAERADHLKDTDDVAGNFATLHEAYEKHNFRQPEILWRLGRAYYDVANELSDRVERKAMFERGLGHVSASLASGAEVSVAQSDASQAHKWRGILLGAVGDYLSTSDRIANAYVIKHDFDDALRLNPNDSTAHHCMAKWCWAMIQISWLERQAAALLFGRPPSCTVKECRESLMASEAIDRTIHNELLLGDVAAHEKDPEEAARWYRKALELPANTEQQRRQKEEAMSKLKKL